MLVQSVTVESLPSPYALVSLSHTLIRAMNSASGRSTLATCHKAGIPFCSVPKKSTLNLGSNEVLLSFVWFWLGDVPDCRLIDVASGAGAAPLSDEDLCLPCILHGDRKRDFVTNRDIFCQQA